MLDVIQKLKTKMQMARNGKQLEALYSHIIVGTTCGHVMQVAEPRGNGKKRS